MNFEKLSIKENPEKIPEELVKRAKKLSSSLLSDAMGSFGTMDYSIKPVKEGMKVAGTALTVKVEPGDNLYLHKSVYLASEGYVLVMDNGGYKQGAVWGEMMTRGALAKGVEGVVLEGAVRDLEDIKKLSLPIFAAGVVPSGSTTNGPGEINTFISSGGVNVAPGDFILGDDDGVVVVQRHMLEEVLQKAEAKAEKEYARIKEIEQGKYEPDWINENLSKIMK